MLSDAPAVRYVTASDQISIAYEVVGEGPRDIVFALGLVPNLELSREVAFLRRWLERLSSLGRVLHYDRRGVGLSDRDLGVGSPEERMDDIRAVMDDAGSERASIVTSIDGGPIALMFAATHPDRVHSLVLYETWARVAAAPDYPAGMEDIETGLTSHARVHWGDGSTLSQVIGHPWDEAAARGLLARLERTNSSPRVAVRHFELTQRVDVRAALPSVQAPCLVIGRTGMERYRPLVTWLGSALELATTVELPGEWLHSWRDEYEDEVLDPIEAFLRDEDAPSVPAPRVLQTLLFSDIVDSTRHAALVGDREWSNLLDRHDALVRAQFLRHQGRQVKHTGDGLLAAFDGPARAVRCGLAIQQSLRDHDLSVRVGIHTGECELRGDDLAGIAVHIAARVCSLAGADEVLASATVRDLVVGSGLRFEDRGSHQLKGIDQPWPIVAALAE